MRGRSETLQLDQFLAVRPECALVSLSRTFLVIFTYAACHERGQASLVLAHFVPRRCDAFCGWGRECEDTYGKILLLFLRH